MNPLQFKIKEGQLTLLECLEIPSEDLDHIIECGKRQDLEWEYIENKIPFTGKPANLFKFLRDLAFRYDMEIM